MYVDFLLLGFRRIIIVVNTKPFHLFKKFISQQNNKKFVIIRYFELYRACANIRYIFLYIIFNGRSANQTTIFGPPPNLKKYI